MSTDEAKQQLARNLEAFEAALSTLSASVYLARGQSWSPRDIVAHLVGWNHAIVQGSRQLMRGELPFYDEDPGEDFSKVNARFLETYASEDREELLAELRSSAGAVADFLDDLDEADWDRDSGVEHAGERLTIRATVLELVNDYVHHARQLENWPT